MSMRKFKVRIAVALITFTIGVVSASLWMIHSHQPAEKLLPARAVTSRQKPTHPDGWKKIDVDGKFSFYLPPDMEQEKEKLIGNIEYSGPHDSFRSKRLMMGYTYIEKQHNEKGRITCDLLTGRFVDEIEYRISDVEIAGRKAKQVFVQSAESKLFHPFYPFHKMLCFPDIGDGTILMFGPSYEDARALDAAKIIDSIEFPQ